MSQKLMGRKCGMTKLFDKNGHVVACTVISVEPNVVTQVKTVENDGYAAVQTGFEVITGNRDRPARLAGKPRTGIFKKAGVETRRHLAESRMEAGELSLGDAITVETFKEGDFVDVMGTSIGKGFQGVMKLHGFKGGPAAHGSGFHRTAGSTGMRSTPGWCLPGGKRASRMGGRRKTVQNLRVIGVDAEKNILLIAGPVPGHTGSLVTISAARKLT